MLGFGIGGDKGENDLNTRPALRSVPRTLRMVMGNASPAQVKEVMPLTWQLLW